MNWMSYAKRLTALLLCFVMVVGMIPAGILTAEAAGETIYVLAGGDFQAGDNGQADHYYSRINMGDILDAIKAEYSTMDGFIFVGDYDGDTHNDSNAAAGIAAMMEEVSERYSNLNHDNSYLIEGNHETGAVSGVDPTGGYECGGYAVYLINETDYCERQEGKSTQIQNVANNLKTWLNDKIGEGYDAPIFVATHVPLAYGTRTYTNGDGLYAKYVFDVLNDAAANGLNIIFMHGHDHAYGADNYLGGEAIYLPVGDKINICVPGDKTAWTEETLNFTYMNAGYVGYYNEDYYDVTSYEEEKLTMTVFAITGNQVTVERWNEKGLYNLKSEGREGFYSNASTCANIGLSYNTAVYTSPQTITLSENDLAAAATIGSYVGVEAETPADDVTTSGSDWTQITAPVPGTDAIPESTTYEYSLDTDGVNGGQNYLIVGSGDAKAMGNGTLTAVDTTLNDDESKVVLDAQANYEWTITSDGKITNGTQYLVFSGNSDSSGGTLSTTTDASAATAWTIRHNGDGNYSIYASHTYASSGCPGQESTNTTEYCFLYYNNGFTTGTTTTESNTSYTVRLYGGGQSVTVPETPAVPDTNGLYGKLVGELTYEVPVGTSAEDAKAAVMAGIEVHYVEAMSTPGSDAEYLVADDSIITWELDPNYDPNTPGDYAVTISYNGVTLGTAEVVVPATKTYYVAEGNGLYLVDMNTTADNAMAAVKAGVTVYSATDTNGTNKTAISDDDVTWNWVDTYNGADSGPYTVEILYNGTSLGTVEVKVNIKYETGINSDWTYVGESEASGGTHTYTLDTDGIDYGEENKYIIVDDNQAIALHATSTSNGTAETITISGNTATTTTRDYEYHFIQTSYNGTRYELITKGDGSQYLYQESSGVRYGTRSSVKFQVNHHGSGIYDIHDIDGTNWYIVYNGSWTVVEDTGVRVRLYKYTDTTGGTEAGPIYAKIEGNTVYTVEQGTSATKALAAVKEGITGYISSNSDGSDPTELDDSKLTWKWKNTFNGNSIGSYWVEISYDGVVLGTVEVKVEPGVVNNYPEYPNEGAVKVNKTATGIDFQSSGIAQVEVSASGVPVKKGSDVIIMLDTSSSMAYCLDCTDTRHSSYVCDQGGQTRAQALEETLADMIAQFQTPGDDGELLDIDVAIADFNGFYGDSHSESGTPYDRDAADMMSDDISYTANSAAQVYTNDTGALDATAFVAAEDLAASYDLSYASGTNYDYAMDAIYQMATAKKLANGAEDRDLFVVFMSDGAAMQWNYYHSQGASSLWNSWITGAWDVDDLTTANLNCTEHAYYYDEVDHNGDGMYNEHRMANAIKGDPAQTYEVIRKTSDLGTATGEENMYMVSGLGAKMFAIAFDPRVDTNVTVDSITRSIATLASEQTGTTQYFYNVSSAEALSSAFTAIGTEIAYAASNARFVDQMGDSFNLQMAVSNYSVVEGTATTTKTLTPKIEIISYDIYTRQDYLNGTITEDKIGDRKGTYTVLETVTFNADGTEAYSTLNSVGPDGKTITAGSNILIGGVIYASSFWYNTNVTEVVIDGVDTPTGTKADGTTTGSTNVLPSETFYWKLGTVQTSELAMRYYVYLEGSMEGTAEAGSYSTNEYATLYYDNYLSNPAYKDTVSPTVAWKSANVSYAFYLVDENGNIIVNQTTGETGSFAHKIAITNPVVYEEILLNNTDQVQSIDVAAISDDVLPKYYDLYDEGAVYEITINSNSTGSWEITKGNVAVNSTYVTQYKTNDASAYSNALTNNTVGDDYTHTIVWFAVVWKVQAHPDTVVVDYGLPVDIHVLTNDMFGDYGKLAGIGAYTEGLENTTAGTALPAGFGTSYEGKYGDAAADTAVGTVRYTLDTMQMDGYEEFAYAVNYTGTDNPGYYYDTVTVIPATTIYYEEGFLTYGASNTAWENDGTSLGDVTQDEDRPGAYSLTDANNIYGYDSVNKGMSTYSLGTAKKVHVDADSYATATFTFAGTGFDVIGMTSNTTGSIAVQVKNAAGQAVVSKFVNTYYGYITEPHDVTYTYTNGAWQQVEVLDTANATATALPETANEGDTATILEDVWVAAPDTANALYQVPVLQVDGLTYATYTVTITATYIEMMDKTTADGYDLYLDAIRIYDPANNGAVDGAEDTTIENAYKADGEGWPTYIELRNQILTANSFDDVANDALTTAMEGLVFIDGDASVGNAQITDYASYGPNNEVYLAPGQRIAFLLNVPANAENVHIGISSANGQTGTYTITNIAQVTDAETGINEGDYYGAKTYTVDTTTDMYYDLTGWRNDIIVISNTGNRYDTDGVISLTNIKFTYESDPVAATETAGVFMTPRAANLMLMSLNTAEPVEDTLSGSDEPEATEPEATEPEATEPEATEPEATEPEATEPEATEPEATEPEATEPEATEPEATEPEATEPEATEPDNTVEEEVTEELGFFAKQWNAIKNAFKQLLSWLGF